MKLDWWKAEHKCIHCKLIMKKKVYKLEGFKVRGFECPKCKDAVLHPKDSQTMLVFNKLKNGISAKVGKLGNSLVVRFPKEVSDTFKIHNGNNIIFKADSPEELKIELCNQHPRNQIKANIPTAIKNQQIYK